MAIYNAKDYKFAKVVANDLESVLKYLKDMENIIIPLMAYRRYKYVNKIITEFYDAKTILELQYKKHKAIKDKKGVKE